jgi:predicted Zn-dependent peptidase
MKFFYQSIQSFLKIGYLSFVMFFLYALSAFAADNFEQMTKDIKRFTLENGMEFIIIEDHSIPNANMYTFWKVGSRNEYPGITGLSHFFEHMMFNGAQKYGPKQFDQVMEAHGGANNAYTTEDITVYTNWFPSDALETIFDLEADRIEHLNIAPAIVESERGVVASERRTGLENSNFRALSAEVKGAAFHAHPYSWPVIGHESDVENWQLEDLIKYHQMYYAPNNAVVVIVGDVNFSDVKNLALQYFASIPKGPEPRQVSTVEPEQKGERRVYVQKDSVTSANILMAWHVPQSNHPDYYALKLLEQILSDGETSRLYQQLIDNQQVATQQFSYMPESIDPNLFYLYAVARQGVSAKQLEQAIIQTINQLMTHGVTEQELAKAQNKLLVNFYQQFATINGKADLIGSYQLYFGDFGALFEAPKHYQNVTTDDIKRVVATYFRKANRTTGILDAKEDSYENDR